MQFVQNFFSVTVFVFCFTAQLLSTEAANEMYRFSYEFQSGGVLRGSFEGHPAQAHGTVFDGTIVVLPVPATATYEETSGFTFQWDTSLSTHTTSQISLIASSEYAFVSFDGSIMDLAIAAGPTKLFLKNVLQGQTNNRNYASTINLGPNDLAEPFLPQNWLLVRVPEPTGTTLLLSGIVTGAAFFRMLEKRTVWHC